MALASLIVGVASFVVSALPLLIQAIVYARRLSKYESLQKSLKDQTKRLTKLHEENEDESNRVAVLLETGDMIMPHVSARFWRRLPVLLAVALGTATFSGATVDLHNWLSHANILPVVLIVVNWVLSFKTLLKTSLFSKDESEFLRNYGLLHDLFYESIVVDLIQRFNANCKVSIPVSEKQTEFKAELQTLKKYFTKRLQAQNEKMLAEETRDGSSGVAGHGSETPRS